MYVIIWEYQVKAERVTEFEEIYSGNGAWSTLFQNSNGFFGTELLSDEQHPHRYVTIDRWASALDYESFMWEWKNEYVRLDIQCEGLTEHEILLGKFETDFQKER